MRERGYIAVAAGSAPAALCRPGAEAVCRVVVDHADRLHEGVADGRADEGKAAPLEIRAHRVRLARARGHLGERSRGVDARLAADEAPDIGVEAAELVLHGEEGLRVLDGGGDFG